VTSIADTTTRPRPSAARELNRRAFLAGGAATSAMIAGAVVVFASLAAYVAFNGLLGAGDDAGAESTVQVRPAGAPQAAAAAAGGAPAAVAPAPAAPTPAAPAPAVAATPGTGTTAAPEGALGGSGAPPTTVETSTGTPVSVAPPATPTEPGPIGGAVDDLDNAATNLGVDLPLNEATSGLTGPLDETLNDSLNGVGGLLGNHQLGNQVTGALNGLLGQGGLTDQLLGGGS